MPQQLTVQSCVCCARMPSVSAVQPLAVDWRDKVKGSRKASQSSASASTSPSPAAAQPSSTTHASSPNVAASVTADGKPDLDLLSKGLPKGWRAMWDKNTGDIYYGNLKTRVRTSSTFKQAEHDWLVLRICTLQCQLVCCHLLFCIVDECKEAWLAAGICCSRLCASKRTQPSCLGPLEDRFTMVA